MEPFLGTSGFDDICAECSCLHLDDNSTLEKEFEVSNKEFLDLLLKI
jgi:hypothetical protein